MLEAHTRVVARKMEITVVRVWVCCILKIEKLLSERWQMGCENNTGVEENYKSLSYPNDRMLW